MHVKWHRMVLNFAAYGVPAALGKSRPPIGGVAGHGECLGVGRIFFGFGDGNAGDESVGRESAAGLRCGVSLLAVDRGFELPGAVTQDVHRYLIASY